MAVWSLLAAILVLQLGDGNASVVDYESIVMEDACDVLPRSIVIASSGRGSALLIKSHQSDAYKSGLTCTLTVKTKSGYRLLVVFEKLSFPNCSDTVQFGSVQNDPGPICKSMPDPLKSTSNTLNITFTTGGAPKSSDQGFEAVVTAFKDGGYCSLGQHKCLSDTKCIADNFVCDGHNNCGDRSDEICDRSISWSRNLGPLVFVLPMMVMIALCIATPFIMRSCSKSDGQIENDRVYVIPASNAGQAPGSMQPRPVADQSVPQGYPTYRPPFQPQTQFPLSMYRQLGNENQIAGLQQQQLPYSVGQGTGFEGNRPRVPAPPEQFANASYPRAAPIVMTLSETGREPAQFQQQPLHILQPGVEEGAFPGLDQPFRAANAQVPSFRPRLPLYQHSHPPLSLYDQPPEVDGFFQAPTFPLAGLGGVGGMGPIGGPVPGFQAIQRFPTFIIIEAGDEDSIESQDPLFHRPPPGPPQQASTTSSGPGDTVFPTLLIQRRNREETSENSQERQRPRRRRRHRHDQQRAEVPHPQEPQNERAAQDLQRRNEEQQPQQPPAQKSPDQQSLAQQGEVQQGQAQQAENNQRGQPLIAPGGQNKTVMRIDAISTTYSLRNVFATNRRISEPSVGDCVSKDASKVRRAKSQWDNPLEKNRCLNATARDLPSMSTYDYASVWTRSSSAESQSSSSTESDDTDTTQCGGTSREEGSSVATGRQVNLLRPTVSLENITVLDGAQTDAYSAYHCARSTDVLLPKM